MRLREKWAALSDRYGNTRVTAVTVILLIGIASILVRLLMQYHFDRSALLYVGLPYLISLAIVMYRPIKTYDKWWKQYRDHTFDALAVFFASSIVLFEGFVCVIFFLPIYFFGISIAFLIHWMIESRRRRRGNTMVSILPVLILVSSLEGTTETLSVDRVSHVVVTKQANLSAAEIMQNLAEPFDLRKDRHWLLSVFPMPYEIEAGSLNAGDIHIVRTRYHRWFVTNTHEGEMHLQIADVQPGKVKTRFLHDSTFFSSYLTPIGTEISLNEIAPEVTEITLRIDYRRKLDPAWYFHPLQQYGVSRMGEFLIDEVMIRD
ncbi:MAG: hypothetical protein KJO82_10775 [Gammaproteobacteria bacterium]|nr:hypothetical protein [Gammaproteobacteria bacterium]